MGRAKKPEETTVSEGLTGEGLNVDELTVEEKTSANVEKVIGSEVHGTDVPTPEQEAEHVAAAEDFAKGAEAATEPPADLASFEGDSQEELPEPTPAEREEFTQKLKADLDSAGATPPTQEERDEFMKKLQEDLGTAAFKLRLQDLGTAASRWKETHRVVTPGSVYLVMVVGDADQDIEISHAWTHSEYDDDDVITPALTRVDDSWFLNGEPFTGNVHSLTPAAPDRHTHRREPIG